MLYQISNDITKSERNKLIKEIAKTFKLTKLLTKSVESLKNKEKIYLQLALAIIKNPKIILVDDLSLYFSKQELLEITKSLYEYNQKYKTTIIMVTSVLECNLLSDYTYIISNGEIVLEGNPKEVLEKDNILNKAGLNLPFMMDLSVKLRDYDLIENIELDMDRLVNTLWK
jgi:ABC-type cobalamin/Fe3+-siderophores transport system ATPase subunit